MSEPAPASGDVPEPGRGAAADSRGLRRPRRAGRRAARPRGAPAGGDPRAARRDGRAPSPSSTAPAWSSLVQLLRDDPRGDELLYRRRRPARGDGAARLARHRARRPHRWTCCASSTSCGPYLVASCIELEVVPGRRRRRATCASAAGARAVSAGARGGRGRDPPAGARPGAPSRRSQRSRRRRVRAADVAARGSAGVTTWPAAAPRPTPSAAWAPPRRAASRCRRRCPRPGQIYGPRGVWTDGVRLVGGRHRQPPGAGVAHHARRTTARRADVVLGQPDLTSEGPAAGGDDPRAGLHLPTGVDGRRRRARGRRRLAPPAAGVATAGPRPLRRAAASCSASAIADGRRSPTPAGAGRLRRRSTGRSGSALVAGTFWVADTGNRRVLGWHGRGARRRPARRRRARPGRRRRAATTTAAATSAASFRWPHAVAGDDADALGRRRRRPPGARLDARRRPATPPADLVLGQAVVRRGERVQERAAGRVADALPLRGWSATAAGWWSPTPRTTGSCVWHDAPRDGARRARRRRARRSRTSTPTARTGGSAVTDDCLCWPYGLSLAGDLLAVADSGNNRVVLWRLTVTTGDVRGDRVRTGVRVTGVVQGVGFRPFVHALATGWG